MNTTETASLFILDPPESLDPPTDTSLALMRESRRRGQQVFYCTLPDLRLESGHPRARARTVTFHPGRELFTPSEEITDLTLDSCAMVHMRKDPPVDTAYLHATYILDRLPPRVLQVNPARALRRHGEKLIPLYFPGLAPPTVVTASTADLERFLEEEGKIVIKPLDDCSGRGIFVLHRGEKGIRDRLIHATEEGRRCVVGQRFLPESVAGDKRVLLLNGEILGWLRRVPADGDFRSNVNAGGHCEPCELTESDRTICERLKPWLIAEEIYLAGVDIIGDHVLEVNITSPSCLREMNGLTGSSLEARVLEELLAVSRRR